MKKFFLMALMVLVPLSSHALFEARIGYGMNNVDDPDYNLGGGNTMSFDKGKGLNADFIVMPPMLGGLGLGLRYEVLKYDFDIHIAAPPISVSGDTDLKRLSLLVNYRILDHFFYVGPIGTIGLSNKVDDISGTSTDAKSTWSVGAEAGVHLGLISIGAEIGKFFGKSDASGTDLKMDGLYEKVLVGFGF